MNRKLLHGKIHGATVTRTALDYEGSIGIDADLLAASGIAPLESVHVWNVTNGERFETYSIPASAGSGEVVVNGAAARRTQTGDRVIIAAFTWLAANEVHGHQASIIVVDEANRKMQRKK